MGLAPRSGVVRPRVLPWTQWFFLKLWENGLAYRKEAPVDWCPSCNTTLAREQVQGEDRHCERCGTPVIKKRLAQWFFRITNYADELLDFSKIDWPERVRTLQTNWIGRSEGAEVVFQAPAGGRSDPDLHHPARHAVGRHLHGAGARASAGREASPAPSSAAAVRDYLEQTLRQSDIQREAADKEKTGVLTGGYAINPVNSERIPIWIADYVLMTYGTGAIMAVPAHDQRDFEFARKYGLDRASGDRHRRAAGRPTARRCRPPPSSAER